MLTDEVKKRLQALKNELYRQAEDWVVDTVNPFTSPASKENALQMRYQQLLFRAIKELSRQ
jgi:hypothetical protein